MQIYNQKSHRLSLIVLILSLVGCFDKDQSPSYAPVEFDTYEESITFSGHLKSAASSPVNSPVDGSLSKIYVAFGDHVTKDQVIFEIDAPDALVHFRKNVIAWRKDERELRRKKAELESKQELYSKFKSIAKNEILKLEDEVAHLSDEYEEHNTKVQTQAASFDISKQQLSELTPQMLTSEHYPIKIKAPSDGILTDTSKANEKIVLGSNIKQHQSLAIISDNALFQLTSTLNENDLSLLKKGMSAAVKVRGISNRYKGTITQIKDNSSHSNTDSAKHIVTFEITPRKDELRTGMIARAGLRIRHPKQLMIPLSALCIHGTETFVSTPTSKKHPVSVGQIINQKVTITSGLAETDKVAEQCHD